MRLVLQHKHHVSRNVGGRLVALLGESDLGSLLPALLDLHFQDFVLLACRSSIWVESLAGDFHLLGAASQDLLQGHLEVIDHRRVLLLPHHSAVVTQSSHARAEGARKATPHATCAPHPEAGEGVVCVHGLVHATVAVAKELAEGVPTSEELLEDGMRVALESVAEVTRTTTAAATLGTSSSLKTCGTCGFSLVRGQWQTFSQWVLGVD